MKSPDSIAIVGMACRLPGGVASADSYWDFLARRGDGLREIPPERWDVERYYHPDPNAPGCMYVRHASFLTQDIFRFEPELFGISPREADHIDPQQRLLLEVAWEAFEDAGMPRERFRGSNTGVFVGGFMLDRQSLNVSALNDITPHTSTGASMTVLSARLAYTFDLHGPTFTVDTACSSSLVATHLARRALLDGECDAALVAGVNLMLSPATTVMMCKGRFLSPDGRSKAFEAGGDGYGRGEGCGVVVLKRLTDAIADGDRIYAVLAGSGVNQDGKTDGLPMPNSEAQEALIRRVCEESATDPASVCFVEAHGTGTAVGDPLETRALGVTYGQAPGRTAPLPIASVKANIGHLEAAAGVAGLIKAALTVQRRTLLPHRSLSNPNPAIKFAEWKLRVPLAAESLPADVPAVVAVNSFGYGGTNAHVLLREAPVAASAKPRAGRGLIPLSAQSTAALRLRAEQATQAPSAMAHTLAARRSHLRHRAVVIADNHEHFVAGARSLSAGEPHPAVVVGEAMNAEARLAFLFTGMGPQWWAMGRELYAQDAVFRATLDRCDAEFVKHAKWSLLAEMLASQTSSKMRHNWVAQPANFFIQAGLVSVLRDWGVTPAAYVGHSVGEIAAAWATGCISFEDAVYLSYQRSQLQQEVAGQGTMLAVGMGESAIAAILPSDVAVAAINASDSVTLAGTKEQLDAVSAQLTAQGVFNRFVGVEVAYHSPHMDRLRERFLERLARVRPSAPTAPLYSTVTGERVTSAVHSAEYWWRNARQPVLLAKTVAAAVNDGHNVFLEIGPHPVLAAAVKTTLRERGAEGRLVSLMRREQPEVMTLRRGLAELHVAGVTLPWRDWAPSGAVMSLAPYPWGGERHWFESREGAAQRLRGTESQPLIDVRVDAPVPTWRTALRGSLLAMLRDHKVRGATIFPGAGFVSSALAAAAAETGAAAVALEDVRFVAPMSVSDDGSSELQVRFDPKRREITVASRNDGEWTTHAAFTVGEASLYTRDAQPLSELMQRCTHEMAIADVYASLSARGLNYGPEFRPLERIMRGDHELVAHLTRPASSRFNAHPALLDGALQTLIALVDHEHAGQTFLPVSIGRVVQWAPVGASAVVHTRLTKVDARAVVGDIDIYDAAGALLMALRAVRCQAVSAAQHLADDASLHREWTQRDVAERDSSGTWVVIADAQARERASLLASAIEKHARNVSVIAAGTPVPACDHLIYCAVSGNRHVADTEALATFLATVGKPLEVRKRFNVLTCRAYWEQGDGADLGAASILGAAIVVQNELPELRIRLVDGDESAQGCVDALFATDDNEEVLVRKGVRYVRRIVRTPLTNAERRAAVRDGDLDKEHLAIVPSSRPLVFIADKKPDVAAGTVLIRVRETLLNFKDFAKYRGILTEAMSAGTTLGNGIGFEGIGTVVAVGSGVTNLTVGQDVWFLAERALQSFAITNAHLALPLHKAYSLPALTAVYALDMLARLQPGERLLVHAATGGLGQAAIQIARHVGAEVYATAGSEAKRQALRAMGVKHVYDSRTLAFADAIMRDTDGVDVVLSSLAGPALRKSLALLTTGGRFIELGKHDIFADNALAMGVFDRSLSFNAIDLEQLLAPYFGGTVPKRSVVPAMLARMQALAQQGVLEPVATKVFPASQVNEAMAYFGQRQHVGRIGIAMEGTVPVATGLKPRAPIGDGTWLVTGGTRGFGLATARWLVDKGVRSIVLASRSGAVAEADQPIVDAMRAAGAAVSIKAVDVADAADVRALVGEITKGQRLAGVVHSAVVLRDQLVSAGVTREDVDAVLRPKALGAWNLHEATADLALDHFVTFGSGSAFVGLKGQASYAGANLFLDHLAYYRRAKGLPALSVAWGAIGDVGLVARSEATIGEYLERVGFLRMTSAKALAMLGTVLDEDHTAMCLATIDFDRWIESNPGPSWRRIEHLRSARGTGDLQAVIADAQSLPPEARVAHIAGRIRDVGATLLKMPADRIAIDTPLRDLGLDSLLAVEFQQTLQRTTGIRVAAPDLISGISARALAARVLKAAGVATEEAAPEKPRATVEWALQNICVRAPYFDMRDVERDGEWIRATARADMRMAHEFASVPLACAGRHGAILGSVAARLADPRGGRIFYPVRTATVTSTSEDPMALETFGLRARSVSVDPEQRQARSEVEILARGAVLSRIVVDYFALPEAELRSALAAHKMPTPPVATTDHYGSTPAFDVLAVSAEAIKARMAVVTPEMCAGHFDDLPAYPIAVLARDIVALWPHLARAQKLTSMRMRPLSATISAQRFIFVGETPLIDASLAKRDGPIQHWRASITAGGHAIAELMLEIDTAT